MGFWKDKEVVITGGAGFIGSNLAITLEQDGARINIIDVLQKTHGGNTFHLSRLTKSAIFLQGSVESMHPEFLLMLSRAKIIFHFAGQSNHWSSMEDPIQDLNFNCSSTIALLEACRRMKLKPHIIFLSTRQVYGVPVELPVDETHPIQVVDINGIHKFTSEQYLILYQKLYQIPVTIIRLTNTYGPGMRVCDTRQSFLGYWIGSGLEGKPFEVWGGLQFRDFIYVDDVVRALKLIAKKDQAKGKIYNLGSNEVTNLSVIADLITSLTGTNHIIIEYPQDRRKIEIGNYHTNYNLLSTELGWNPSTNIKDGLTKTIEYYKLHLLKYLF
jgi:UDP-glucose 4-epimerase